MVAQRGGLRAMFVAVGFALVMQLGRVFHYVDSQSFQSQLQPAFHAIRHPDLKGWAARLDHLGHADAHDSLLAPAVELPLRGHDAAATAAAHRTWQTHADVAGDDDHVAGDDDRVAALASAGGVPPAPKTWEPEPRAALEALPLETGQGAALEQEALSGVHSVDGAVAEEGALDTGDEMAAPRAVAKAASELDGVESSQAGYEAWSKKARREAGAAGGAEAASVAADGGGAESAAPKAVAKAASELDGVESSQAGYEAWSKKARREARASGSAEAVSASAAESGGEETAAPKATPKAAPKAASELDGVESSQAGYEAWSKKARREAGTASGAEAVSAAVSDGGEAGMAAPEATPKVASKATSELDGVESSQAGYEAWSKKARREVGATSVVASGGNSAVAPKAEPKAEPKVASELDGVENSQAGYEAWSKKARREAGSASSAGAASTSTADSGEAGTVAPKATPKAEPKEASELDGVESSQAGYEAWSKKARREAGTADRGGDRAGAVLPEAAPGKREAAPDVRGGGGRGGGGGGGGRGASRFKQKKCGFLFREGGGRAAAPIVMSQALYKPGSKIENHMRVVGDVTKKLHQLFPARDVFENTTYGTCAVVASAGILLQREFGPLIDGHDAVFRFNSAYTKGLEKYVGSKSTMRMVNRENFGWGEDPEEICLQHITTETLVQEYLMRRMEKPAQRIYGIDPQFYKRVVTGENTHPTNGYFGIKMALELCECVHLYGFVRNWYGYMTYHYHDDYTPRTTQAKRDSVEYPMITSLIHEHSDRLFFMHPCILDAECADCPKGARCEQDVPHPVPAPGFCYGHGEPGGHPPLRHWTARSYFSSSNWSVPEMSKKGHTARRLLEHPAPHISRDHHEHSNDKHEHGHDKHEHGHDKHEHGHGAKREKKKKAPVEEEDEDARARLNDPLPGLPFADERRSCFRKCKAHEDCPGGATGICSGEIAARERCLPWPDHH